MNKTWGFTLVVATITSIGLFFPAIGEATLGDRTLKKGMIHNDVKELQEHLLAKGEFPYHTATGYFGDITVEAVKEFQKKQRLKVDGIAGPQTNNKLKILRSGDMGLPISKLQRLLRSSGVYNGAIDGIYGSGTKNAVIQFQKKMSLTADGIAGPLTMNKLNDKATEVVASSKELTVESTAYTAYCKGCSGITKLGIDLKKYPDGKVVAVDPNVIPLGSTVEVDGYGTAVAADIGGGITGNEVDLFFANEASALNWGRKNIKVRVKN